MSQLKEIRTSLEVGFPEGELPEEFERYRGLATRTLAARQTFPYEDSQFEVVMLAGNVVSRQMVKEAHRVLRPEGRLFFKVLEKTPKQEGWTLPNIYSTVREGFNIVEVGRSAWWKFWTRRRTITICALKKNWKTLTNTYRPYV